MRRALGLVGPTANQELSALRHGLATTTVRSRRVESENRVRQLHPADMKRPVKYLAPLSRTTIHFFAQVWREERDQQRRNRKGTKEE